MTQPGKSLVPPAVAGHWPGSAGAWSYRDGGTLAPPPVAWDRGAFMFAAAAFFVAQIAIILLVGERPHKVVSPSRAPTVFRAMTGPLDQDQLAQSFFVADPLVFASATPQGFSGRAWLRFQPVKYGPAQELEPPSPLALDTRHLGAKLPRVEETNLVPFELVEQRGPQLQPLPIIPAPSVLHTQSVYYLEGPLAGRQIGPAVCLPSWPANQILSNSVVQFAVNRAGQVVLHRLVVRCGLPDADAQAVAITGRLRFTPLPAAAGALTSSKAIFEWRTLVSEAK